VAATVTILFLIGFPMVCTNGSHFFGTWDAYCAAYTLIVLALFEVIAVAWIYGPNRFVNDIKMMTGPFSADREINISIEIILEWLWKLVAPVILVYLLIKKIINPGTTNEYTIYNEKFTLTHTGWIGYTLLSIPLALIVGGFVMKAMKYGVDSKEMLMPTGKWGPKRREDRVAHQHERTDGISYLLPEEKSTMLSDI